MVHPQTSPKERIIMQRHQEERLTSKMNRTHVPPPLPIPSKERPALDTDVTAYILDFLDPVSFITSAGVSKAFRDAVIPRQRNVSLGCFHSYESMKKMGFTGAVFFSGRLCNLVTNDVLADLPVSFPNLARVDLSGCRNITSRGVKSLIDGLGNRLEALVLRFVPDDDDGKRCALHDIVHHLVSKAPRLKSLSLVLYPETQHDALQPLNNNSSIRNLKLEFERGPFELPTNLPKLKQLDILTEVHCIFDWSQLTRVNYPSLTSLVIADWKNDSLISPVEITLCAEYIISILSPKAASQEAISKSLTVRKVSRTSKLYKERNEQEALLEAFLTPSNIDCDWPKW